MKIILLLCITVILNSCNSEKKIVPGEAKNEASESPRPTSTNNIGTKSEVSDTNKNLYGYYTGEFLAVEYDDSKEYTYSNVITVSIDSIVGSMLYGHSIVAGNDRPFKGMYENKNGVYSAEVSEPGDDKYDGVFYFSIDPASQKISGTWKSNSKDVYVTKRQYDLNKKLFVYDKNNSIPQEKNWNALYDRDPKFPDKIETLTEDVSKINASNTLLKKENVENMFKGDLEVIRNSIYARHGYSFKNRKIRYFFDNAVDWYMPVSTDVRNELTELELKNIDMLKRYEDHAGKYYDDYGR
ncbi:MAG: YARHG domain-containing protein [Ignavibacteria bacterium]